MQTKKITQSILISVPIGDLLEAGIDTTKIIETCVSGGGIIIRNAEPNGYICDGNCEDCPVGETDCDGDCENCPCNEFCDDSEVD